MKKTIFVFTLLLEAALFLVYNLPFQCYLFFALTVMEAIVFTRKGNTLSVAGWWLYAYIVCSFIVIAIFKFTPSRFTMSSGTITESSFSSLAETSIYVMFTYILALIVFCRSKNESSETDWSQYAPNFNLSAVFIMGFAFTFISSVVGIGRMGAENTRLPFHLSGIIQFVRTDLIPVMALCVYANRKRLGQNTYKVIVLLFIWSLFETMVRLSKSAIIFSFIPIIMYELISDRKILRKLIRRFAPIMVVVLVLYPVIESMRHSDVGNAWVEFEEEVSGTFTNPNSNNYIVQPFNRSFLTGYLFAVDETTVDKNKFFDFSQAPMVVAMKGAPRYQTFVIDGYPDGIAHSSGTSPFIDSFLMGGYGLLYISIFIMVMLAEWIDKKIWYKSNYVIAAILCVAFYRLFDMPLITFFLNEMSIRYLVVYAGVCIYIFWRYNKQR